MISHPSFGPVPLDAWREAMRAPAVKTTQIIRKYVPGFRLELAPESECKRYRVRFERNARCIEVAHLTIEAGSEAEAKKLAKSRTDELVWDYWETDDWSAGEEEVTDIEEVQDDAR